MNKSEYLYCILIYISNTFWTQKKQNVVSRRRAYNVPINSTALPCFSAHAVRCQVHYYSLQLRIYFNIQLRVQLGVGMYTYERHTTSKC